MAATKTLAHFSGVLIVCFTLAAHPPPGTPQTGPEPSPGAPKSGDVKVNSKDGLSYVWIPPGTFMLGCSPGDQECSRSEKPPHTVTITKEYWLGKTEVTVAAYQLYASATGQHLPPAPVFNSGWTNRNMPIINVNWHEAHSYCTWIGGRLPSEAEWEYAARGGDPNARYGELDHIAWYGVNSGGGTHEVAQKQPNGFGLYDTLGNVWEWVNDWFDVHYYEHSPDRDPPGPTKGQYRILRGGAWNYFPRTVRVSVRIHDDPEGRVGNYGIRCVGESNLH